MIELTRPVLVHLAAVLVSQHDSLRVASDFLCSSITTIYTLEMHSQASLRVRFFRFVSNSRQRTLAGTQSFRNTSYYSEHATVLF